MRLLSTPPARGWAWIKYSCTCIPQEVRDFRKQFRRHSDRWCTGRACVCIISLGFVSKSQLTSVCSTGRRQHRLQGPLDNGRTRAARISHPWYYRAASSQSVRDDACCIVSADRSDAHFDANAAEPGQHPQASQAHKFQLRNGHPCFAPNLGTGPEGGRLFGQHRIRRT